MDLDEISLDAPNDGSQREEFLSTIHVETTAPADEFVMIDDLDDLIEPKQTTGVAEEFEEPSETEMLASRGQMIGEMQGELVRQNSLLKERLS